MATILSGFPGLTALPLPRPQSHGQPAWKKQWGSWFTLLALGNQILSRYKALLHFPADLDFAMCKAVSPLGGGLHGQQRMMSGE